MTSTDLQLKRPAEIVERPTGPVVPPPMPAPEYGHLVDTVGSLTVLAGALTGLAVNASLHPGSDLLVYPQGASFAAIVLGAVVLARTPVRRT